MSSFLDNLAASWGAGYNVDEFARRRAMNDALMNLGTTLMMAGGSGSWQRAAPLLAQALPSAYGTFQKGVLTAQEQAERQAEKEWQAKQREFIEEERKRLADERAQEKQREELERKAADKRAEMLEAQINTDYEKALKDPDIQDKDQVEQYWNTARTALENYYLTKDPAMLAPLEKVMGGFKQEVEYSENLNRELEEAARKAGFKGQADRERLTELQKQAAIEQAEAAAESRRALTEQRQKDAAAEADFNKRIAGGQVPRLDPTLGVAIFDDGAVFKAPASMLRNSTAAEFNKKLFTDSVNLLNPLYGKSKDPRQNGQFATVKALAAKGQVNPANYGPYQEEVVSQIAMAFGAEPPQTPEDVQRLFAQAADMQGAYRTIHQRIYGANNPTTTGGVASFAGPSASAQAGPAALSPKKQAAFAALVARGVSPEEALVIASQVKE